MSVEDNKQVVLQFFAAGERGDMDACLALLADDITWTNIGSTAFSGSYVGKRALIEELIGPLFGQLKNGISSTIENLVGEGDLVVAQSSGTAETVDGVPYNNSYCQVMRVRGVKICSVKEYFDTDLAAKVLRRP
jgi:ketosteroid isomerase-like protein